MKQTMQFRFFPQTTALIEEMAHSMHLNKTGVVERAIVEFAKQHHNPNAPLLKYAGILNEPEADDMLASIQKARKNKKDWAEL